MLDENEVKARLEREEISDVEGYHVEIPEDSTGDVAAFIYVIVPDEIASRTDFIESTERIDDKVFELFSREFQGYWPYVRFRSASEMATL